VVFILKHSDDIYLIHQSKISHDADSPGPKCMNASSLQLASD